MQRDLILDLQPVEENTEIANVIVDCAYADRLSEIAAAIWIILFFSFVIAIERILPPRLKIVDVPANHRLRDFVYIVDPHFLFAPALKKSKRLFI